MKCWIFGFVSACAASFKRVEPRLAVFRGVTALLLAAFALDLQPRREEARFTPIPAASRAAAQGISFCGVCCDNDHACWAKRQTDWEEANRPRGQIEGVCWASLYNWEKDEATGQNVLRTDRAIYTPVRFNETEVRINEHHGRNAGFEFEVGSAWSNFINANHAAQLPEGGNWRWSIACVSLNSPRNSEVEQWKEAQEQARYKRVFLPAYSVAEAPELREAGRGTDSNRRERDIERQREEKARRDAAAAADAAAVRDVNARLGREQQARTAEILKSKEDYRIAVAKHQADAAAIEASNKARQADYERKKAEADAAQRAYQAALLAHSKKSKAPRQCTTRSLSTPVSFTAATEGAARAGLRGGCNIGGSETVKSMTLGAPSCSQRNVLHIKPPPVGKCLSCIDEKMAINLYGYVPGKGYPSPKTEWICKATAQCVAEKCSSGEGSKVLAQ